MFKTWVGSWVKPKPTLVRLKWQNFWKIEKQYIFWPRLRWKKVMAYFSVLVGKTMSLSFQMNVHFLAPMFHLITIRIAPTSVGQLAHIWDVWKSIMNSVVFTVEQVLLKKLLVFNQGWATLDTTNTKCWAIGHLTVVFLVAKPLIWSEAEVDHVVIETSV